MTVLKGGRLVRKDTHLLVVVLAAGLAASSQAMGCSAERTAYRAAPTLATATSYIDCLEAGLARPVGPGPWTPGYGGSPSPIGAGFGPPVPGGVSPGSPNYDQWEDWMTEHADDFSTYAGPKGGLFYLPESEGTLVLVPSSQGDWQQLLEELQTDNSPSVQFNAPGTRIPGDNDMDASGAGQ